jgi:PIN domain nuclease of toxin-antitoxin system
LKLLLDTNALVWFVRGSKDLGKNATRAFLSAKTVYFSSFSLFELQIKRAKEKITLVDNLADELESRGIKELTPKGQDASEITRFTSLTMHDPFDRMILAQASSNNLTLLTSDRALLGLGFDWIKDARV